MGLRRRLRKMKINTEIKPYFIKLRQAGRGGTDFRFKMALLSLVCFFALLSAARLILFCINYDTFSAISFWPLLHAFLYGLKFDFATAAVFVLPPIFLLMLPLKARAWLKFWTVFLILEFIFFAAALASDLIYFGYVKRHMGEEILNLSNDITFIIGYALGTGLPVLIMLLASLALLLWAVNKFINSRYAAPRFGGIKEIIFYALICFIMFIGIFGGFAKNPLNIPDAYVSVRNNDLANLSLNGIFTSYQVLLKGNYIAENETDIHLAADNAVKYLICEGEEVPLPHQYPLMRKKTGLKPAKKMPNVVIILLESWVPQYIDEASGRSYGVTPVFDELIKNGLYFDNAYAFELRSLQGIAAVLASAPALPKLPKLGYGLERSGLSKLPQMLAPYGYKSIFAQTSARNSFNLFNTAKNFGFEEVYGMEDMPRQLPYAKSEGYGYDYDMYNLLAQKLKDQKQPFFLFAFTGITHTPYLGPLEGFNKYPNTTEENKYLNSLYYADFSIGYFLEQAKKNGWFNNTVFIFAADHTFNRKGTIKEKYHIPLLIYGPKFIKAQRNNEVASQLDILPTLLDILRLSEPYAAAGKSLLADSKPRYALFADGYTIGIIAQDGALRHTRAQALESEGEPSFDSAAAGSMLLSLDKTFYTLLREQRWEKND